ncbi:MAG TPA: hypothetical protein PKA00_14945, partial [Saprospiraceae bacterium]|nr:hypothetical protein [Saprospiraceae bacterium]
WTFGSDSELIASGQNCTLFILLYLDLPLGPEAKRKEEEEKKRLFILLYLDLPLGLYFSEQNDNHLVR